MEYKTTSIIIQARSTSKRFPGKIHEKIGQKTILQMVIDVCNKAAAYVNSYTSRHGVVCGVALAIPEGDEVSKLYSRYTIISGDENDVLSRYKKAADKLGSDFIVRITSDCPLIPDFIICKAINFATRDGLDYLTNADPRYRTSPDGHDVEVISRKLLDWLNENANEGHREHVTSYLIKNRPSWAKCRNIVGYTDFSALKISVDTKEDLIRLQEMHDKISNICKDLGGDKYRL